MLLQEQPPRPESPAAKPAQTRAGTVLVTGATGLLGTALCVALVDRGHRVIRQGRTGLNPTDQAFPLENLALIEPAVGAVRPDWIIHTAGNTSVDGCEQDPGATRRLHVEASAELARAARRHGSRLLHVSTDSVYDGEGPGAHAEDGVLRPCNLYARTKQEGEQACLAALDTAIVARVNFFGLHPTRRQGLAAWIIDGLEAGRGLDGFTDVYFNPLFVRDLAGLIIQALQRDLPGGIYNFGAVDSCSKYDFARRIALLLGADPALVRPATLAAAGLRAPRPRRTVMDTRKLAAALDRPMPTIQEGMQRLLAARPPRR